MSANNYILSKLQVAIGCSTDDFALNEIRALHVVRHTGNWDRKIIVQTPKYGDIGIDKDKNAFVFFVATWDAIHFSFEQ